MGADVVVAVDVLPDYHLNQPGKPLVEPMFNLPLMPDFMAGLYDVELIMISAISYWRLRANPPDVMIRPKLPPDIGLLVGFDRAAEIIEAGMQAAEEALPKLREVKSGLQP
jgi:hypothetical protein